MELKQKQVILGDRLDCDLNGLDPVVKAVVPEGVVTERYLALESLCRAWIEQYISGKLSLPTVEKQIRETGLLFEPVSEVEMDSYQAYSTMGLDFFYLRNDVKIERLKAECFQRLSSRFDRGELDFNGESMQFVQENLSELTKEKEDDLPEFMCSFGPFIESCMASNNSVVLGLRFADLRDDADLGEDWITAFDTRIKTIRRIQSTVSAYGTERLGLPCAVINYNNSTVDKLGSELAQKDSPQKS